MNYATDGLVETALALGHDDPRPDPRCSNCGRTWWQIHQQTNGHGVDYTTCCGDFPEDPAHDQEIPGFSLDRLADDGNPIFDKD